MSVEHERVLAGEDLHGACEILGGLWERPSGEGGDRIDLARLRWRLLAGGYA